MESGANPEAKESIDGATPLFWRRWDQLHALRRHCEGIAGECANVEAKCTDERTHYMGSAACHTDVVDLLLQNRARIEAKMILPTVRCFCCGTRKFDM